MANYNLTQTGDEVQAYIDSIPVIDVTGTLSGSNIVFATNPYTQIAANYAADCGSIVRLTVAGDVYVIRITGYDSTYYTGSVFKDNQYISVEIGESSAQGMIEDANAVALIPVTGTESGGSITLSSNPFTRVQTAVNAGQHVVVRVTYGSDIIDFTMNTYSASVATYIGTANFLQSEFQLICSASSAVITNRSTSNTFTTGESVPNVGIDATPTQGSDNLVKSGGVADKINEIYGTTEVIDKYVFGGTSNVITFDALSLAEDGDAIEFEVKCELSNSNGAFAFAMNGNNIAISLAKGVLGIKSAANVWQTGFNASQGSYNFGATAGDINATPKTFLLIREGTSLKLYINGTFYKELENAPTITFDRLGGVQGGNYWSGELDFFRYAHNGVTTELMDFAGYSVTGDVTITTHSVVSGIVKDIQDDITDLQASTSTMGGDISDLQTEIRGISANASELSLFADVMFNDKGVVSIPSMVEGYTKITDVSGDIYIGTQNVVQLLNFKDGSVTYRGVTLTKSGPHIVLSGTCETAGYINLSDLTGYGTADAAVSATTLPQMPNNRYYINLCNRSGNFQLYTRSKTSTFIDLLTNNAPYATINDINIYGAFLIYLQVGTTYNGIFDIALIPEGAARFQKAWNSFPEAASSEVVKVATAGIYAGDFIWGSGIANVHSVAATTNVLLSKGVQCAWFGDSLSELKNLPDLVAKKMAITIKDCSFAGSPLTYSSEYYQDTGFMSLCSQIAANNFTPCEDAINAQYNAGQITEERKNAKLANLATLAAIDFSTLDRIVVFAGTNDLGVASLTLENFKSGFASALQTLITAYPNLSIYVITPPYRTDGMNVHPNGLKITDIVDAMTEVCQPFAIPCYNFLALSGVNQYNAATWLTDGLHQSDFGDEEWSKRIARWLQSY